jgi:hypothetical protein
MRSRPLRFARQAGLTTSPACGGGKEFENA